MDELEKIVTLSLHRLDEEPEEGHFQRFEDKLKAHKKANKHSLLQRSMRIASVVLLLIMTTLYVNERFYSNNEAYVNPEFEAAQYYYKTEISDGLSALQTIDGVLSDEQRELLLQEMEEADQLLQDLKDELKVAPDDPRIISAMLHHYRMKAAVINNIVNDLNIIKDNQKKYHYETTM